MSRSRYSKGVVSKAGATMVSPASSLSEREQAKEVVNYWREIHGEVLQRALEDIEGLDSVDETVLVAGRIKKLDTIIDKLRRPLTPSELHTIYDIAGCRLIVEDSSRLEAVCRELSELPVYDEAKTRKHDYIARPRSSGYRGRHVILHYEDLASGHRLFVEVQVRTKMQHDWATAVEMHDAAVKTRLKFNEIDNAPGRFFRKAALLIAQLEEQGSVDARSIRLLSEGRSELPDALRAVEILKAACGSIWLPPSDLSSARAGDYCLVDFRPDIQLVEMVPLARMGALATYFEKEKEDVEGEHNIVLVRGASAEVLEELYPNYFGDISSFIELISRYMDAFA